MRIVLATERTRFDAGAEQLAIELARRARAGLHMVLPLIGNPEYQIVAPDRVAAVEEKARAALEELAWQARERGVAASLHVRAGEDLWREIVDEAHERQADLLAIRRIGRRGVLARLVVGEMVAQVAAHATVPVLMAAEAAVLWSRRVLAVLDPQADVAVTVRVAAQLATLAKVPLAAIAIGGGAAAQIVTQGAHAQGTAFESVFAVPAFDASLSQRVKDAQADLLVLGVGAAQLAHGRLGNAVEALIGARPFPTVLVGAAARPG
jgi:nucleotide-binding universal stress UspA family protein